MQVRTVLVPRRGVLTLLHAAGPTTEWLWGQVLVNECDILVSLTAISPPLAPDLGIFVVRVVDNEIFVSCY